MLRSGDALLRSDHEEFVWGWREECAAGEGCSGFAWMWQSDRAMQSDLTNLSRACCEPQRFVTLQGAPIPAGPATGKT